MSEQTAIAGKMALEPDLYELLNAQVTKERYAAAVYSALGTWADSQGFEGLTKWADEASAEEAGHAQKFIGYLRDRASVRLEVVEAPPVDFGAYDQALLAALTLERGVSEAIREIYRVAVAEADGATAALAEWFLDEQVKAEKELVTYIQRVRRGDPLDLLDIELAEHTK